MKRIIAAVSFAVLAVPAFAVEVSAPFEQTQLDRAVPNVQERADHASSGSTSAKENIWANDYSFTAPAK
jgi:hypothetical protein